jgi:hypothetical protein
VTATGLVSSAHRSCLSWHKTIRRLCRGRRGRRNDFSVVARLHGRPRESASFRLLLRYDDDEDDDLCGCLQYSCGEMYSMHVETGRPIGRQERLLRHAQLWGVWVRVCAAAGGGEILSGDGNCSTNPSWAASRSVFCDDGSKNWLLHSSGKSASILLRLGLHSRLIA